MEINVEIPTFEFNKSELKKEIKRATYSWCYMCEHRINCTLETKQEKHCMNCTKAREINKAIDLAYDITKQAKKSALQMDERKD